MPIHVNKRKLVNHIIGLPTDSYSSLSPYSFVLVGEVYKAQAFRASIVRIGRGAATKYSPLMEFDKLVEEKGKNQLL